MNNIRIKECINWNHKLFDFKDDSYFIYKVQKRIFLFLWRTLERCSSQNNAINYVKNINYDPLKLHYKEKAINNLTTNKQIYNDFQKNKGYNLFYNIWLSYDSVMIEFNHGLEDQAIRKVREITRLKFYLGEIPQTETTPEMRTITIINKGNRVKDIFKVLKIK